MATDDGGADALHLRGDLLRLRRSAGLAFSRRFRRNVRRYAAGQISRQSLDSSVQGWLGHARHADAYGLRSFAEPRLLMWAASTTDIDALAAELAAAGLWTTPRDLAKLAGIAGG